MAIFISYLVFHALCASICTAVTFKITEHLVGHARDDARFFPIAGSFVFGPLAIIFVIGYFLTRSAIESMDPEMKKLKNKVETLETENADLGLRFSELDTFVRELQR
jgi:hypothetical protein